MCVMLESCHIAGTSPRRTRGVKNLLDGFGKFIDEFFNDLWPYFVWAHSVISLKFQKLLTLFTETFSADGRNCGMHAVLRGGISQATDFINIYVVLKCQHC